MTENPPKDETETMIPDDNFAIEVEDSSADAWKDDETVEDGFHDLDEIDSDQIQDPEEIREEEIESPGATEENPFESPKGIDRERGKTVLFGALGVMALVFGGFAYVQFAGPNENSPSAFASLGVRTPEKKEQVKKAAPVDQPVDSASMKAKAANSDDLNMALLYSAKDPAGVDAGRDVGKKDEKEIQEERSTEIVISNGINMITAPPVKVPPSVSPPESEPVRVAKVENIPVSQASSVATLVPQAKVATQQEPSAGVVNEAEQAWNIEEAKESVRKELGARITELEGQLAAREKEAESLRQSMAAKADARQTALIEAAKKEARQQAEAKAASLEKELAAARKETATKADARQTEMIEAAKKEARQQAEAKVASLEKELASLRKTMTAKADAQQTASLEDAKEGVRKEMQAQIAKVQVSLSAKEKEAQAAKQELAILVEENKNLESRLKDTQKELARANERKPVATASAEKPVQTAKKKAKPPVKTAAEAPKKPLTPVVIEAAPPQVPAVFIRAAMPGAVWVSSSKMSSELKKAVVGDTLPGIGKILEIRQKDGKWEVIGQGGILR